MIEVSDTKQPYDDPNRVTILVGLAAWALFEAAVSARPVGAGTSAIGLTHTQGQGTTLTDTAGQQLHFDRDEWDAFVAGVRAGEFSEEAMLASV